MLYSDTSLNTRADRKQRNVMPNEINAEEFTKKLKALQSDEELKKHQRYFKFVSDDQSSDDYFIGVRMGSIFDLAKERRDMPVAEIEKLWKVRSTKYVLGPQASWASPLRTKSARKYASENFTSFISEGTTA